MTPQLLTSCALITDDPSIIEADALLTYGLFHKLQRMAPYLIVPFYKQQLTYCSGI